MSERKCSVCKNPLVIKIFSKNTYICCTNEMCVSNSICFDHSGHGYNDIMNKYLGIKESETEIEQLKNSVNKLNKDKLDYRNEHIRLERENKRLATANSETYKIRLEMCNETRCLKTEIKDVESKLMESGRVLRKVVVEREKIREECKKIKLQKEDFEYRFHCALAVNTEIDGENESLKKEKLEIIKKMYSVMTMLGCDE